MYHFSSTFSLYLKITNIALSSPQAMRFPMNQHRLELKSAQEARERERELAKEIQEGDMDDEDAGGDFDAI